MKKIFLLLLVTVISLQSCKSDDDEQTQESQYPKTVNIKYEITASERTSGYISEFINNEDFNTNDYYDSVNLIYIHTVAQKLVNKGTILKLGFVDALNGGNGSAPEPNYQVILRIYVDDNVVKETTYAITSRYVEVFIEYTFD